MKKLDLEFDSEDMRDIKYFEGKLIKKWDTPSKHLMLGMDNVKLIRSMDGVVITLKSKIEKMNFLVPKRRQRVVRECQCLNQGDVFRLKLIKETRSGKFCVAEVGV